MPPSRPPTASVTLSTVLPTVDSGPATGALDPDFDLHYHLRFVRAFEQNGIEEVLRLAERGRTLSWKL